MRVAASRSPTVSCSRTTSPTVATIRASRARLRPATRAQSDGTPSVRARPTVVHPSRHVAPHIDASPTVLGLLSPTCHDRPSPTRGAPTGRPRPCHPTASRPQPARWSRPARHVQPTADRSGQRRSPVSHRSSARTGRHGHGTSPHPENHHGPNVCRSPPSTAFVPPDPRPTVPVHAPPPTPVSRSRCVSSAGTATTPVSTDRTRTAGTATGSRCA